MVSTVSKDIDVSKLEVRQPKWEFTLQIKTHQVQVQTEHGMIWLQKLVYVDRGEGAKVEVSGRLIGRPYGSTATMRSQNFNINGYPQWKQCPQLIMDIIARHGFAREEL